MAPSDYHASLPKTETKTSREMIRWIDHGHPDLKISGMKPLLIAAGFALATAAHAYDPLATDGVASATTRDLTVNDASRHREIPVRVFLPSAPHAAPVVMFSHGLGGSRSGSAYLGEHWAARGYVVVYLQHPGSDAGLWKDKPIAERMQALEKAASGKNLRLRVQDVTATLDQLAAWNATTGHALTGRLDLRHVGMSGHSFGAVTSQVVSGQRFPFGDHADPRIGAVLALSPSAPRLGSAEKALRRVKIPCLLMTGTKDASSIGHATPVSRRAVFAALPPGDKYELVLDLAEHSAFTDHALPGDVERRNPNHHRAILAISTAFWDAYLTGNADAKRWLDGAGPRSVLEAKDQWQRK